MFRGRSLRKLSLVSAIVLLSLSGVFLVVAPSVRTTRATSYVLEQVTLTISPAGAPNQGVVTVSGCASTTVAVDGAMHAFNATPSALCTYTTAADGSNARDRFSGGETWSYTSDGAPGPQSKSNTVYHEGKMTVWYSVSGGGSPTAPTMTFTLLGSPAGPYTMTLTPYAGWLDWHTPYTITNPTTGSTSAHRFAASSGTSGTESDGGTVAPVFYNQYVLSGLSNWLSATRTSFGVQGVIMLDDWYDSGTSVTIAGTQSVAYSAPAQPFYVYQACGDGTQLVTNVTAASLTCWSGRVTYTAANAANMFFLPSGGTLSNWNNGGVNMLGFATQRGVPQGTVYSLSGSAPAWEIDYTTASSVRPLNGGTSVVTATTTAAAPPTPTMAAASSAPIPTNQFMYVVIGVVSLFAVTIVVTQRGKIETDAQKVSREIGRPLSLGHVDLRRPKKPGADKKTSASVGRGVSLGQLDLKMPSIKDGAKRISEGVGKGVSFRRIDVRRKKRGER